MVLMMILDILCEVKSEISDFSTFTPRWGSPNYLRNLFVQVLSLSQSTWTTMLTSTTRYEYLLMEWSIVKQLLRIVHSAYG